MQRAGGPDRPPPRRRKIAAAILMVGALFSQSCFCPELAARNARRTVVEAQTADYVHKATRAQVLDAVDQALKDTEWTLDRPFEGDARTTAWRGSESSRDRMRIEVMGQDGAVRVRAELERQNREQQRWKEPVRTRDLAVERAVLKELAASQADTLTDAQVQDFQHDVSLDVLEDAVEDGIRATIGDTHFVTLNEEGHADETSWSALGDTKSEVRFIVQTTKAGPKRKLQVDREVRDPDGEPGWTSPERTREGYFELDIIRRLDPAAATQIDAKADEAADAAYDRANQRKHILQQLVCSMQ